MDKLFTKYGRTDQIWCLKVNKEKFIHVQDIGVKI
jgi:hypothetical protein